MEPSGLQKGLIGSAGALRLELLLAQRVQDLYVNYTPAYVYIYLSMYIRFSVYLIYI